MKLTSEAIRRRRPTSRRVVSATKQASNLTHQMLAYAGKASFHQETLDVNESFAR